MSGEELASIQECYFSDDESVWLISNNWDDESNISFSNNNYDIESGLPFNNSASASERRGTQERRCWSSTDESKKPKPLLSGSSDLTTTKKTATSKLSSNSDDELSFSFSNERGDTSVLSFNNICSSESERYRTLEDRNGSTDESKKPLLSNSSELTTEQPTTSELSSNLDDESILPFNNNYDNESVLSFNNNCSSASERHWASEDRNWSADESEKPLLSKTLSKSKLSGTKLIKSRQTSQNQAEKSKVKFTPSLNRRKKSKAKKHLHGAIAFIRRILKSEPSEHRSAKAVLGFPIGLAIAACLFFTVIQPLDLDPDVRNLAGSIMAVVLGVGYSFSVQVRCILLLVLPIFFGKAGRSFIGAFALIFLLNGPIDNIVTNCREVARSLSCLAQLLANHTIAKWKLRLNPLKEAIEELQEEGFLIQEITRAVKNAFGPLTKELEDRSEVDDIEEDLKEVEKIIEENKEDGSSANAFSVAKVESKHKVTSKLSQAQAIQEKWEKKLDLRCEDVFGKAVIKCRQWFGDMWDKCLDALWILGYVLCLPLKMTFFCELVKIIPGALGMTCDSMDVVEPGLGETYHAAKEMIEEIATGMKVNLQYRLTSMKDSGPNLMTAEEIRAGTMNEFESKARWVNFILLIVKRLVTFTFLLVFHTAHTYQQGFLTHFQFDNIYISKYFRKIDARRHTQGKQTLLPLKKTEKKTVIFPTSLKLMPCEKKQLTSSIGGVIFRVILTALVVYVDYLLVWIMDVIYRNSRIEYHQTGEHFVNITVSGSGFMAEIVRMFLTSFNSHHKLDSVTTNHACLPKAREPSVLKTTLVFAVHFAVLLFLLMEAYGLRLRRIICSFFYRKREKKRVLYLYNEMLKKRKGFLRHMRHRVRKQIRNRTLKGQTNVLTALTLQFPRLCCCLKWLKASRDSCLICQEPEGKTFQRCPTPGCGWGYCAECWKDIKRKCYACGGKADGESGTDPSEDDDDESSDSSDLGGDNHFLH